MKFEVIKRTDDGTLDLFEKDKSGKLIFLSNHLNQQEVDQELENLSNPLSNSETVQFFDALISNLSKI